MNDGPPETYQRVRLRLISIRKSRQTNGDQRSQSLWNQHEPLNGNPGAVVCSPTTEVKDNAHFIKMTDGGIHRNVITEGFSDRSAAIAELPSLRGLNHDATE